MKLSLSQKYMLTISEAAAYFGIGPNKMRIRVNEHPELGIRYGNRNLVIRERVEGFFKTIPLNENRIRKL